MRNLLIVISGPSGVGKGTLVKLLTEADGSIVTSISCTTRKPREGEVDGKDYFFLSREAFDKMVEEGGFLEYDEHFGNCYGTPLSFVEQTLKQKSVILEIDVVGALNAKKIFPDTLLIMLLPPSIEELSKRLLGRGSETAEQVEKRLERVKYELSRKDEYDYAIVNDDLQETLKRLRQIILQEREK